MFLNASVQFFDFFDFFSTALVAIVSESLLLGSLLLRLVRAFNKTRFCFILKFLKAWQRIFFVNPRTPIICALVRWKSPQESISNLNPKYYCMPSKRNWTPEEKEQILLAAISEGVNTVLKREKLSSSVYYEWKARYKKDGLKGLSAVRFSSGNNIGNIKNEISIKSKMIEDLSIEIDLYKELVGILSIEDIDIKIRKELIRKYNQKGLKLNLLFDICRVTKSQYYKNGFS